MQFEVIFLETPQNIAIKGRGLNTVVTGYYSYKYTAMRILHTDMSNNQRYILYCLCFVLLLLLLLMLFYYCFQRPHLVNLNEDPLMSECLLYYVKDGVTRWVNSNIKTNYVPFTLLPFIKFWSYNTCSDWVGIGPETSSLHLGLSFATTAALFQPHSLTAVLLHVILGLPLRLFPSDVQASATRGSQSERGQSISIAAV